MILDLSKHTCWQSPSMSFLGPFPHFEQVPRLPDMVIVFQDGKVTSCDVTTIKSLQTIDENSVAKVCSSNLKTTVLEYGRYRKRSAGRTKEREQLQKRGAIR